jgi:DUF2950 family protein
METVIMHTRNVKPEIVIKRMAGAFASAVLLLVGLVGSSSAQTQPKTFASPGEASSALFKAAQSADEQTLEAILGAGKEVTSSGDDEEDKLEREQFTKKYQEMHRLVREPDGSTVLYIGAENWPFPIPLISKNDAWYFNAEDGKQEMLFRRIGENETTAIAVCEEFAITERVGNPKSVGEAKAASQDPITRFAQSLVTAGTTNADVGSLFHGYYFRRLGDISAAGVNQKGLVLVAFPAEYRSSGVKTFLVTKKGIVFEKDLGLSTVTDALNITVRTSGWNPAE